MELNRTFYFTLKPPRLQIINREKSDLLFFLQKKTPKKKYMLTFSTIHRRRRLETRAAEGKILPGRKPFIHPPLNGGTRITIESV